MTIATVMKREVLLLVLAGIIVQRASGQTMIAQFNTVVGEGASNSIPAATISLAHLMKTMPRWDMKFTNLPFDGKETGGGGHQTGSPGGPFKLPSAGSGFPSFPKLKMPDAISEMFRKIGFPLPPKPQPLPPPIEQLPGASFGPEDIGVEPQSGQRQPEDAILDALNVAAPAGSKCSARFTRARRIMN